MGRRLVAMLALLSAWSPAFAEDEAAPPRVRIGLSYTADLLANVSGGLDRGAAWLGRADVTLDVPGEAVGLRGPRFFLDVLYTHGPDFSGRRVGDAQVVSNVQGDRVLRPLEAYVELPLGGGVSARAGLVDLNNIFDVQTVGGFFTNSSHGIGIDLSQSGRNGPSIYPVTSGAAVVQWEGARLRFAAGAFNAVAGDPDRKTHFRPTFPGQDGSLLIAEAGASLATSLNVHVGAWTYTSREPPIDPGRSVRGSRGAYGQAELVLAGREDGTELASWVRGGLASGRANRATAYIGGGVTYGSDRGRIGLAVAHARQSGRAERFFAPEEGPQRRAETSLELGYAVQATDYLSIQPTVHYVINPGWRADVPDALVLGVRFAVAVAR